MVFVDLGTGNVGVREVEKGGSIEGGKKFKFLDCGLENDDDDT
jgi:hypothetical protein